MNSNCTIPEVFPVQFIERTLYVGGEIGIYRLQLGGVVEFEGRLDEALLERAMGLLLKAEPVLGCSFIANEIPPYWRRLDLSSEQLLSVRASSDPGQDAAAFIAEHIDTAVGPMVRAVLLRSASSDTLAVRVGHLAVDGGALKETLYLIGEIYRHLREEPDWIPLPNLDGVRYPMARAGLFETLRSLGKNDLKPLPSDPEWSIPLLGSGGPITYVRADVEPDILRRAAEIARSADATVNDIILTALYRTMWRLLGSTPDTRTPLMITCELRKHLPPGTKTALSNISSAWSVSVSPATDESFDGTLARVAEETRAWKRSGAGKASAIGIPIIDRFTRKKGLDFARKLMSGMMGDDPQPDQGGVVLTNIGVIEDELLDFGTSAPIAAAWLLPPTSLLGVGLGVSTYRNRLHFAAGVEFASVPEALATGIVAGVAAELESWVGERADSVV